MACTICFRIRARCIAFCPSPDRLSVRSISIGQCFCPVDRRVQLRDVVRADTSMIRRDDETLEEALQLVYVGLLIVFIAVNIFDIVTVFTNPALLNNELFNGAVFKFFSMTV